MAASPASQYHRQEVSSGLAGGFLQGQISLSADLLTATRVAEALFLGNRKAPSGWAALSWKPTGGSRAGMGTGDRLRPRARVPQGPGSTARPGDGPLREQRALLVFFLAVWFFYVFHLQDDL